MAQDHISLAQSCVAPDSEPMDWKVEDACNEKGESESSLARSRHGEDCACAWRGIMVNNSQNRISITTLSNQNHKLQRVQAQRKRTSDGSIKGEQDRRVDDATPALLQAYKDGQTNNIRLQVDMDILRRRITAMRVQDREGNLPVSQYEYAAASKQRLERASERASITGHRLREWNEDVLR
ncbi:hypothetical protein CLCR_04383 [Cladophialophora carrionii]|uniref:Uncharacterized protein n=1 Tax=Cladophialophora carrionii TaxID=86049 RepID=A0A1C1CIQ1_9EURO|nr:hypothetical protein CLCR_04383 [Cladophialophora carrionii]